MPLQGKHTRGSSLTMDCMIISLILVFSCMANFHSNMHSSLIPDAFAAGSGSPITIYRDSYSPTSEVHISIFAPDFNSNPYAIDSIGDDDNGQVIVSTREGSIPYKLVESGPNTGIFVGYVILSGITSVCSPVCGPTDGFLAAGGDDAITVSFTYGTGQAITYTSSGYPSNELNNPSVPEFGPLAGFVVTISTIGIILFSRKLVKN